MIKQGFTLAEVLLTLSIIGVVAALTIPAVITKVTQDQYVVALKKAYNTLKAVEREAIQEHGEMQNWDWTKDVAWTFETYFKSHFDILKNCGATTDDGCFAPSYEHMDGINVSTAYNTASHYKIITSDGMSYGYYKYPNTIPEAQGAINVDVNGKKRPNKWGRDMFSFAVFPSGIGIKPSGAYNYDGSGNAMTQSEAAASAASCSTTGSGGHCGAKVLAEGDMNY